MHLRELVNDLLEFCYPSMCICCDAMAEDVLPLCDKCVGELGKLEETPYCSRCAMPLAQAEGPCPFCRGKGLRPYRQIVRLGDFEYPLKDLIHKAKYNRTWPLAEHLADRLLARKPARRLLEQAEVLVPVPLHPLRQIARGYNQADVIARHISRRLRIKLASPAARTRNTETQTHLHSRQKREQNLRDAFALIDPRSIAGKHVVVIDDVMTTGATLRSLARVLRPARPISLSAAILAVADPRGRGFQVI